VASGRSWKVGMDVPHLLLGVQVRREKLMNSAAVRKQRNLTKKRIPIAVLESTEQRRVVERCLRRGWKIRKLVSPNVRGWPDLFIADPCSQRCAFVEMKIKNRSSPVSRAQEETLALLRSCGLHAFVAWGAADALTKLEEIFRA